MRWTYQTTVFNTNPKCSIPTQSIRCWPRVFNTKASQCTVFNSQYSSSIHEVDIPTHSGGQRTPRVPLQFPPFLLTLLSYWASSTSITSRTFPTLYILSFSFYSFLFLLLPRSTLQKILGLALPGSRTLFTPLHTCCDLQSSLTSPSSLASPNDL